MDENKDMGHTKQEQLVIAATIAMIANITQMLNGNSKFLASHARNRLRMLSRLVLNGECTPEQAEAIHNIVNYRP